MYKALEFCCLLGDAAHSAMLLELVTHPLYFIFFVEKNMLNY